MSVTYPVLAQTGAEISSARDDSVILALSVDASITSTALQKAGTIVRNTRDRLVATERKLQAALRRADLGDHERVTLRNELEQTQADQRRLIDELRAKDLEYAAALDEYRKGLMGLLDQRGSKISAALERYAAGDVSALDSIQEFARINRRAREAGAQANLAAQRAQSAAEQRAVATLMVDAVGKGQRHTEDALRAWEEAVDLDPTNVDQWLEIARLKRSLGDTEGMMKAAVEFFNHASSDQQLANGWVFFSTANPIPTPSSRMGGESFGEALKIFRRIADREPNNSKIRISLLTVLDAAVSSETTGVSVYPATVKEAEASRAAGKAAMIEGDGVAKNLLATQPEDDDVLRAVWQHWRIAARFAFSISDAPISTKLFEKSFTVAASRRPAAPDDLTRVLDRAMETDDRAEEARLRGDYPSMGKFLVEAAALKDRLYEADPENVLKRREVWFAELRAGTIAGEVGDPRTAAVELAKALTIGRAVKPERNGFAIDAMLRMALTSASVGDLKATSTTLTQAQTLLASDRPVPDFLTAETGVAVLRRADLALFQHDYTAAEAGYKSLGEGEAPPVDPKATLFDQQSSLILASRSRLGDLEIERGRISAARAYYQAIRNDLVARQALEGRAINIALVDIMLGHLTPGFTGWAAIADDIDRERNRPDALNYQQPQLAALSALVRALAAAPAIATQDDRRYAIASFDASAHVAGELADRQPDDKAASLMAVSMAVARSRIHGGRSWSEPLVRLQTAATRGWIIDDMGAGETLMMVLARSAFERRPH